MSTAVRRICDRCGAWCREDEGCLRLTGLPAVEVQNEFVDLCPECVEGLFSFLNEDPEGAFDCDLSVRDKGPTVALGDTVNDDPETDEDEDERVLHSYPTRNPVMPLPVPQVDFMPGDVHTIEVRPKKRVALKRLIVPSTMAGHFTIEDVSVTIDAERQHTGAMLPELLSEAAIGQDFPGWADATHPVVLRVRRFPQPMPFTAMFMCELLPEIGTVEP